MAASAVGWPGLAEPASVGWCLQQRERREPGQEGGVGSREPDAAVPSRKRLFHQPPTNASPRPTHYCWLLKKQPATGGGWSLGKLNVGSHEKTAAAGWRHPAGPPPFPASPAVAGNPGSSGPPGPQSSPGEGPHRLAGGVSTKSAAADLLPWSCKGTEQQHGKPTDQGAWGFTACGLGGCGLRTTRVSVLSHRQGARGAGYLPRKETKRRGARPRYPAPSPAAALPWRWWRAPPGPVQRPTAWQRPATLSRRPLAPQPVPLPHVPLQPHQRRPPAAAAAAPSPLPACSAVQEARPQHYVGTLQQGMSTLLMQLTRIPLLTSTFMPCDARCTGG